MAKPASDEQPVTCAAGIIPRRCATARSDDCAARFLVLPARQMLGLPEGRAGGGITECDSRGKVARDDIAKAPGGDTQLPVSPEFGRPQHHAVRGGRGAGHAAAERAPSVCWIGRSRGPAWDLIGPLGR
jgi:hypothetical protein